MQVVTAAEAWITLAINVPFLLVAYLLDSKPWLRRSVTGAHSHAEPPYHENHAGAPSSANAAHRPHQARRAPHLFQCAVLAALSSIFVMAVETIVSPESLLTR